MTDENKLRQAAKVLSECHRRIHKDARRMFAKALAQEGKRLIRELRQIEDVQGSVGFEETNDDE
jgi:hypothetical protein